MNEWTAAVKEIEKSNLFMQYNHIELVSTEPDTAFFRLNVCAESKNQYGLVHGGALYALADNCAGTAAHTDGRHYVTQNSSFTFIDNQTNGTVYAKARVRHRGKTTCLVAIDIIGDNEKLLATGEFTYFHVHKPVLPADQL